MKKGKRTVISSKEEENKRENRESAKRLRLKNKKKSLVIVNEKGRRLKEKEEYERVTKMGQEVVHARELEKDDLSEEWSCWHQYLLLLREYYEKIQLNAGDFGRQY